MKPHIILLCAMLQAATVATAQDTLRLSLAQCRRMALSNNERLLQADNAVRQAELDRKIAAIASLPRVDGSAMGVYGLPDTELMGMKLSMRGTYVAGINITQPIYVGGKISTGKRLAAIGERVAAEKRRLTRADVMVEADNAYYAYCAVCQKQRLMQALRTQMDTLYAQTHAAVDAGIATDNDLLRIEAKRGETIYQQQKVDNGAELCRLALCNAIGTDLDRIIAVDDVGPDNNIDTDRPDVAQRPELQLLSQQIAADRQQIRMARADMLPTVALTASGMYYGNLKLKGTADYGSGTPMTFSQEFRDGSAMLMLAVKIPIFHWGETAKKVRRARLVLRNSELQLQRTSRLLSIETEQARRNVADGRQMVASAEQAQRQAEENLRVMRNRYSAAMAPLTDMLDAQTLWQQARSNLIEAQAQLGVYRTEYLRATGQL